MELTAGSPHRGKVVHRREDGGGVIEIPVATVADAIDFARTAGGGEQGKISREMLAEMAANFASYPGPVPIGFGPHPDDDFAARAGPSPGFVESLSLRGDTLWAQLDLGPGAFSMVADQKAFRGFSIEARKDLTLPTKQFAGWVITGGVFTNRPSLDVNFRIAATGHAEWAESGVVAHEYVLASEAKHKETDMADDQKTVSLAHHEAKVGEVKAQLSAAESQAQASAQRAESLQASLAEMGAKVDSLKLELDTVTTERNTLQATSNQINAQVKHLQKQRDSLQTRITEMEDQVRTAEDKVMADAVTRIVAEAGEKGLGGAIFDGWEADPAAWLRNNYASLEAFEKQIKSLYGVVKLSGSAGKVQPSGHDPKTSNEPEEKDGFKLTAEEQAKYESLGLSHPVDFGTVTSAAEAKKIWDAAQKKKQA